MNRLFPSLGACLKKERGYVADQPQPAANSPTRRKFDAGCGGSGTTPPRSWIFRDARKRGAIWCGLVRFGAIRGQGAPGSAFFQSAIRNPQSAIAFTLIELLVVISIIGLLAGLAVPALKNLGKSNLQVSATRQLVDDIARARQLAISQRTTVYMVFVPESFWNTPVNRFGSFNNTWWNNLSLGERLAVTNLLDKQLTGYNFISLRSIGDQPGRGQPRYLGEWKSLPDGAFIASNKFYSAYSVINDNPAGAQYPIYAFNYTNSFPFPVESNFVAVPSLPYIAFNYLGQLTVDGLDLAPRDEYIPLAQGTVGYATDGNKALVLGSADFSENPPGNSTNSMFNLIRIDRLTGRTTLLQQKVQ